MATYDNTTVGSDVSPSYQPSLSIQNNVFKVGLGDGYEQRLSKGVNPSRRTFTLPYKSRSTADTNNITIGRNGHNIQGAASDLVVSTERAAFTLVYVDSTQGWLLKDK